MQNMIFMIRDLRINVKGCQVSFTVAGRFMNPIVWIFFFMYVRKMAVLTGFFEPRPVEVSIASEALL